MSASLTVWPARSALELVLASALLFACSSPDENGKLKHDVVGGAAGQAGSASGSGFPSGAGGLGTAGNGGAASGGAGNSSGGAIGGLAGGAGASGAPAAGAPAGSTSGSAGASGGNAGSAGSQAACPMIASEYASELEKQLACNPSASSQCTNRAAAAPGCECRVFIQPTDPFAIEHLSNVADGWFEADCSMPSCSANCSTVAVGTCQPDPKSPLGGRCITP